MCDCEVDKGGLGLYFWFVMRIGKFGVKNEMEFWVIFNFFVIYFDVFGR